MAVAAVATLPSGCQLLVNPWHDELAGGPPITTPSVELARGQTAERTTLIRSAAPIHLGAVDGTVTHGSLYFEDAAESKGSEDGRFALTAEDYFDIVYCPTRFLVNATFFPVSAVVTPPWVVMASDGILSRQFLGKDHDAERWTPPAASDSAAEQPK